MAATKNLCAQIGLDLHQKISEAREQAGLIEDALDEAEREAREIEEKENAERSA